MLDKDAIRLRLAEAKAWRVALDQIIAGYESLLGERSSANGEADIRATEISHDAFVGMSILDASKAYLKMVGRPARTTDEIYDAITRGGVRKASKDSVAALLQRADRAKGDIQRAGRGTWGLAEWYAGRRGGQGRAKKTGAQQEPHRPESENGNNED